MTNERVKDIEHYMNLPYTIILRRDDEGDINARIDELSGCIAHGKDEDHAIKSLREMQKLWLEDCIQAGDPVPEPQNAEPLPSGKWLQRVPRSLHHKLGQIAKREGTSLNQLVTSMLSEAVAAKSQAGMLRSFGVRFSASRAKESPKVAFRRNLSPKSPARPAPARGRRLK